MNFDGEQKNSDKEESDACDEIPGIQFIDYRDESQLEHVMSLVVSVLFSSLRLV